MNKFYDKLLLAIALLALLAGVGFYVTQSGAAPSGEPQVSTATAGNPYQAIPVPHSEGTSANWPEAPEQSTGWVYDVFTPPKIYIDKDGRFSAEGVTPPPPPVPFGVYLSEIRLKPYRIQIQGYIEEDLKDASKSLILFYDEESSQSIRSRIGKEVAESEFEVVDFTIVRNRDEGGSIDKVATATILDKRSGEKVVLVDGQRLYEEGVTVVIKSNEDASVMVELAEAGESFETALGQYLLKEINLEESTVTVEKQASEELEAETQVLIEQESASSETNESTTPQSPPTDESADLNGLESIF